MTHEEELSLNRSFIGGDVSAAHDIKYRVPGGLRRQIHAAPHEFRGNA